MSLLIDKISYKQAIRTIREIILDTNPVQCLKVVGQDFVLSKSSIGIAIKDKSYTFDDAQKFYDLTKLIREAELDITILPNFVAVEYCENIINFDKQPVADIPDTDNKEEQIISRENYFSVACIESVIENHYNYYCPYDGTPKTVEAIFNELDYFARRRLILWVAYYLIDKKRMYFASASEMMSMYNSGDSSEVCGTEGELKNVSTSVTTRVGDTFSVTEKDNEMGNGMDGFTSFWGDQFSYLTKLQLWIRDQFERQFKDFSLRDDAMISQTFEMEKPWQNSAWIDTHNFTSDTIDILQSDSRTIK